MADLFLSYDHDDAARAAPIASALEKAGHSVWWDRHIQGGAEYNDEIEAAVEKSDAVIVLWSKRSVKSAWVRDEAAEGREQRKLVPVRIDDVKPPMGFRQFQTIDLSGRSLNRTSLQQLLDTIDRVGGGAATPPPVSKGAPRKQSRWSGRPFAIGLGIIAVIAIAALLIWNWRSEPTQAVVTVTAADNSTATRSLADDLFIKLGALQSANSNGLQLVQEGSAAKPDLSFRVGQRVVDGGSQANVGLLAGANGDLIWSQEFRQNQGSEADLRQQVAYAVALVLACATDAMAPGHRKLKDSTLKLYLGGCAKFERDAIDDPRVFAEIFGKVSDEAPDFQGGWAKLLIAETEVFLQSQLDDVEIRKTLRKHIEQARKLNPHMAEAYDAEAWMMPIWNINGWMPLSEAAVKHNPFNVIALAEHSNDMFQVGQLQRAILFAKRAVQADPLSPWVRSYLIMALAHAGQIEAAKSALAEAERLWPGASDLIGIRFYLLSRYDDPRQALSLLRSGKVPREDFSPAAESFLEARIDPSPANVERAIGEARALTEKGRWFGSYIETLAAFGRKEELIKALFAHDPKQFLGPATVFETRFGFLQDDVRFMAIMKKWRGQFQYWRKSDKWPDFCSRPGLPYDCKKEAEKLASTQ